LSTKQKATLIEDSRSSEWSIQQQDGAACQHASHLDFLEPVLKASNSATKTGEHKMSKCRTSKFTNIKTLMAQSYRKHTASLLQPNS